MKSLFRELGVHIPEIMLPAKGTDLTKWSVIACDQYTSQPDYWHNVDKEVGSSPSTLKLTFPEIYLKSNDRDARIKLINETMQQYINSGILESQRPGFILVDRSTPNTASRKGLILAVDLECYDYRAGSQTLIRATEGTVLDRIPPRVKIRENAPIELPHIMLLIDDPDKTVIERVFDKKDSFEKLYDFNLMQGGGHIRGWKVEDADTLSQIAGALAKLADPFAFAQKYGLEDGSLRQEHRDSSQVSLHTAEPSALSAAEPSVLSTPEPSALSAAEPSALSVLLFAAGDGNHSLATAKAHWENVKAELLRHQAPMPEAAPNQTSISGAEAVPDHPARYALVEVVNVHDEGLEFEPIHRVLFGIDRSSILDNIKNICCQESSAHYSTEYTLYDSKASMEAEIGRNCKNTECAHLLPFILEGTYGLIKVHHPSCSLEVGTLQSFIDELIKKDPKMDVDYIHGNQAVTELGSKPGCMGFFLPVMDKHDLFRTVVHDGVLPRKAFSMGEAEEKRYYLECRRIK